MPSTRGASIEEVRDGDNRAAWFMEELTAIFNKIVQELPCQPLSEHQRLKCIAPVCIVECRVQPLQSDRTGPLVNTNLVRCADTDANLKRSTRSIEACEGARG